MSVRIYQLSRGFELWQWLCPKHLQLREMQGWEVKQDKDPPHELLCDLRVGPGKCSESHAVSSKGPAARSRRPAA